MIKAINRSIAARHEEDEKGFTLIELLVVILIIGVLAAIAIPAFLNQREGAWVSQVESDLKNAAIAAESYAVGNNGSYSSLPTAASTVAADGTVTVNTVWDDAGFNGTQGVGVTATIAADGKSYTLLGNHNSLTENYQYNSATGVISEVTGTP
jgi:type IV pilus assembly protein PilA